MPRWLAVAALAALTRPPASAALDVRLGWLPTRGAAGYRVYRQVETADWLPVEVVAAPPTDADGVIRHVVADVPVGQLVGFSVSAYDASGSESAPSNALRVLVEPPPTATATATPPSIATATITPLAPSATPTPAPATASATSTSTPSATPTATRARRLRGRIAYQAGAEPLAGARVTLAGDAGTVVATADADGRFALDGVAGEAWQLTADAGDGGGGAVSALDAAWVLQTIAGARALDDAQRLACDVTGNGSLTALDAALLLQQAVGLRDAPPVTARCASPWLFVATPADAPGQRIIAPQLDQTTCASGAIAYEPLSSAADGQDFTAVLFGDCTGNWRPAAAALQQRAAGAAVRARPPLQRWSGRWVVALAVRAPAPFSALDVRLAYDPRAVVIEDVRAAGVARHAAVAVRADASGRLAIALAAPEPVAADDDIVLRLAVGADAAPDLRLLDARLDEQPVAVAP